MIWNQIPLGYCVTEVKKKNAGGREDNLLSLSYGNIVRRDIATADGLLPESFDSYNVVFPGDTVLRLTDLQNDQRSLRVGLVEEVGIITSAYVTVRPNKVLHPQFLNYFLKHMDFRKDFYALGAGVRQSLKFDELRSVKVPVPALAEQKAIADYLDCETARIDSLINKKRHMIELLELKMECEARQITQDSGKVESLRRSLNRIQTGTTPSEEFFSLDDNHDSIPWITPGDFNARLSAASISKSLRVEAVTAGVIKIHPKDSVLVVGIGATAGRVSMADRSVTSNQQITGLVCSARLLPRFLAWQLWARRNEVLDTAPYTTLPILNNEFLKSLMIFAPSVEEQRVVATRLDRLASRIGATKQGLDTQIARFIELRQTLISAAVTGDLKITDVAA